MPGPWEDYKPKAETKGPWEDYALKPESKSMGEKAIDSISAFSQGAKGGMPFANLLDKAEAASRALGQETLDLGRSKDKRKSFGDYYSSELSKVKQERESAIQKSPTAGTVGEIAGAATGLAIPVPGAGQAGILGALSRIGGSAAISAVERGTSGEKLFDPALAKQGATVAGGIQAGLESVPIIGRAAGPLAKTVTEGVEGLGAKLQDIAGSRAAKAAIGNNQKAYDALGGTPEKLTNIGKQALEEGVVSFGNSAKTISKKAKSAAEDAWSTVKGVFDAGEKAKVRVRGQDIADEILLKAQQIEPIGSGRQVVNQLLKEAEDISKLGDIPLEKAQDLKSKFKFKVVDPTTHNLGEVGNNIINGAFGNAIKGRVADSGLMAADEFARVYQQAGQFGTLSKVAAKQAKTLSNNRSPFSLTDYLAAGAGGVAGAALGGAEDSAKGAAVLAIANNLARTRGNSALASVANKVGSLIESSPQVAAKYGEILNNAARGGSAAFTAAHTALMQKDPDYRKLIEEKPRNAFERRMQGVK